MLRAGQRRHGEGTPGGPRNNSIVLPNGYGYGAAREEDDAVVNKLDKNAKRGPDFGPAFNSHVITEFSCEQLAGAS
jgi:hypothetical protein